jgi:phage baseplate assembly protein V
MNDIIEYSERFAALNPTFRVGIVQQQDTARAKVRVVFPDYDKVISWWLPIVFPKTQNDKAYWIPDIGEQVVCLMDLRDEAGAVLGAIYSDADLAPVNSANKFHLAFQDGTSIDYDRAAHLLDLLFQDTTQITYNAQAHLLDLKFQDQGEIKYDGTEHILTVRRSMLRRTARRFRSTRAATSSSGRPDRCSSEPGCWLVSRGLAIQFKSAR